MKSIRGTLFIFIIAIITIEMIYSVEADSISVKLNSPINQLNSTNRVIIFNATLNPSSLNLTNSTTYFWLSNGTLLRANQTITGQVSNDSVKSITIASDGVYIWNEYACGINATSTVCAFNETNRTFTLDTIAPNITNYMPLNNQYYNSSTIRMNISTDENATWCTYSFGDGMINYTMSSLNKRNWNGTITGLSEFAHHITFMCNDTLNNLNKTTNIDFYTDTIFPLINYTLRTDNNNEVLNRNDIFVNVTVTDTNYMNTTFKLYDASGSEINLLNRTTANSFVDFTSLEEAIYGFRVFTADLAGNQNQTDLRTIIIRNPPQPSSLVYYHRENIAYESLCNNSKVETFIEQHTSKKNLSYTSAELDALSFSLIQDLAPKYQLENTKEMLNYCQNQKLADKYSYFTSSIIPIIIIVLFFGIVFLYVYYEHPVLYKRIKSVFITYKPNRNI